MTSTDIKILLLRKKMTQTEVARRLNTTVGMVNHIITRRYNSKRLKKDFADMLKIPVNVMWPEESWV
jgi:transcriptional regulator